MDFTQAGQRVRLGRNMYGAVSQPLSTTIPVLPPPGVVPQTSLTAAAVKGAVHGHTNSGTGSDYFTRMVAPSLQWEKDRAGEYAHNSPNTISSVSSLQTLWESLGCAV